MAAKLSQSQLRVEVSGNIDGLGLGFSIQGN